MKDINYIYYSFAHNLYFIFHTNWIYVLNYKVVTQNYF